ncbi:MAG: SDR family NAD-dependent epimerase/dehydratase, partial [Methylobacteriaceae bacterium]|nr:SDR family NAD-dependent epimerase/dehydratase [Methylobacteriaceae bacterium]
VDGKVWNAGYHNLKVIEIAEMVQSKVDQKVEIVITPTNDHRSYHVSSERIHKELGFAPRRSVEDAIIDLKAAFADGKVPNSMTDDRYYNIKRMQSVSLR